MIPIIGALLGTLAENGLGLLSSAIQAKGKEVVENTLGIKIPDNPTPEDVAKLESKMASSTTISSAFANRPGCNT